MKKLPLLASFMLVLGLGVTAFAGCGEEPPATTDPTIYNITSEESPYYDVNGTYRATAGTTAEISIDLEFPNASSIANVQFNGQDCTKVNDTDYTFTMPEQNVEIIVTLNWIDTKSDSYLSWNENSPITLISAKNDADYNNDPQFGTPGEITYDLSYNASIWGDTDVLIMSTNQNVIPNSAISNDWLQDNDIKGASGSNQLIGGTLYIDRSQINVGTTQIVFTVEKSWTTSYTIVITVNVTE